MSDWEFAIVAAAIFAFVVWHLYRTLHDGAPGFWVGPVLVGFLFGMVSWLLIESFSPLKSTLVMIGVPVLVYVVVALDAWSNPPPTQADIEQSERDQLKRLQEKYPND